MDIQGHAAIVTGGGSGLGAETARFLAKAGAKVAVFDINVDGAKAVAEEIGGTAVECDVSKGESVEAAFATARDAQGPARVLINCAGIGVGGRIVGREGPMPLEHYTKVIEINLIGTFNCLRLAANDMATLDPLADDERGVIISTASVAAYEGQIGQAAYSSSKGAIVALTLPAARELARYGVRVLAIAPGYIDTPLMKSLPDKVRDGLREGTLFPRRFGEADEFAKLVLHMVDNIMLNGECVRLDGGVRMTPK